MKIKRDDINDDFKTLEKLIRRHNDDKLLYAFFNYVDKLTKLDKEILDHSAKVLKSDNDFAKLNLESKKNYDKFCDQQIEVENRIHSIKKDTDEKIDRIKLESEQKMKEYSMDIAKNWAKHADEKFELFTRSAYLHPRFNGLFLLLRGKSHIMNVNALSKESAEEASEIQNLREDKQ